MPAPFSNGSEGDMFLGARCNRCTQRNPEDGSWCEEAFEPLFVYDTTPEFFETFSPTRINSLGVECTRYEYDPLAEG